MTFPTGITRARGQKKGDDRYEATGRTRVRAAGGCLCGSGVGKTAGQSKVARRIAAEAFSRLDMDVLDIVDNVSVAKCC